MINYIFGFHRGGGQKEKASIQEQETGVGSCPIFDADGPLLGPQSRMRARNSFSLSQFIAFIFLKHTHSC
jgi:hypothetical protein